MNTAIPLKRAVLLDLRLIMVSLDRWLDLNDLNNLILACHRCNMRRYNFTTGIDPQTGNFVQLFNPRVQPWSEHFSWSLDGLRVVGLTTMGRATCKRLDMNDDEHDDGSIIRARRLWLRGGWHPPTTDPILPE